MMRRADAVGLVLAMMVLQMALPLISTPVSADEAHQLDTSADLAMLEQIGLQPIVDGEHGWSGEGGEAWLRFRDARMTSVDDWPTTHVSGHVLLQHEYPVPTDWVNELSQNGIDCQSFLPPSSFHCKVPYTSVDVLVNLDVSGMMRLDAVDKLHPAVAPILLGLEKAPFSTRDLLTVNLVLSGQDWPDLPYKEGALVLLHSHDGRFATATVNTLGVGLLAANEEIEWIEPRPVHSILNDVAQHWMAVDQVDNLANITTIDSSFQALDGDGIIVTVADTGIDNGVNNSNMHGDFRDHLTGILSVPVPQSVQYWAQQYQGSWDDGAADEDSGHGTHVAGSVLGDGTESNGDIKGTAPEAHLLFQATEQYVDFNSNAGVSDGYGLYAIPDDIRDLFEMAAENGSLVHTNSWGSSVAGQYTTSAMQADDAARTHANMSILFAAANEGADSNGDGEVDYDSMGSPGTAKNVLTVGAGENHRNSLCNAAGDCYYPSTWGSSYGSPISGDYTGGQPEGMAAFSSRGPTDDGRLKPDLTAPGTWILSTKSRSTSDTGWLGYDSEYTYMGGTSMATPLTAGAVALLIQHLKENVGHSDPSSALIKAIVAAGADDMTGQYSSSTNGAGEEAPNFHEGWGRINMGTNANVSFLDGEALSTGEQLSFSFNVSAGTPDLRVMLSWTDPASTTQASVNLVNDLDLALKSPGGSWTNLSNNLDNLRGIELSQPSSGTWEVVVSGTNVPTGPQEFALVLSRNLTIINGTTDDDMDGVDNDEDDCSTIAGSSSQDRSGCPDSDGDGYSDPDSSWSISDGADAFPLDYTQWNDTDGDGFGDNANGNNPDSCPASAGWSNVDRQGCLDSDSDGWSNPDSSWATTDGADSCALTAGTSDQDRNGCEDTDGDGYSDPEDSWNISQGADAFVNDPTQWADSDGDGYGDNASGTNPDIFPLDSSQWVDTDGDGYGDNASGNNPDIFPLDFSQWADSDGDGYGDNASGTTPDSCINTPGNSTLDVFGCVDSDGDGYSDAGDAFPSDPNRHADTDGDGFADDEDDCPLTTGNSTEDTSGCLDTDGDGWSDAGDALPLEPTQHEDSDGDGYGDDPLGNNPDSCPQQSGTSVENSTFGCPDGDGDGWDDDSDSFPQEPSQWSDSDGDGFGDNPTGDEADDCPQQSGDSTTNGILGCPDADGDGWADSIDDLPEVESQQIDSDSDGFGDNPDGFQPDSCPWTWGNSTDDRFGCLDSDGDGVSDAEDDFPDDPLRAGDADADGLDDALEDDCSTTYGTSSEDRRGCPDSDGDGYSDTDQSWTAAMGGDAFPLDPTQWADSDDDGFGDETDGFQGDSCPSVYGTSSQDRYGCPDSDSDGFSNADSSWSATDGADAFPEDSTQWLDSDGDGLGDSPSGNDPDDCPLEPGTSYLDRSGCADSDGDGRSDADLAWGVEDGADRWPDDATQMTDSDGDGFGDSTNGTYGDDCPGTSGKSFHGLRGCLDSDGDGWADVEDAFPELSSQWLDSDGDGWGDNQSLGAERIDHQPDDPDSWGVEISLSCDPETILIDMAVDNIANVVCTVTNDADVSILVDLQWDLPIGLLQLDSSRVLHLRPAGELDSSIQVHLAAKAIDTGEFMTVVKISLPGGEQSVDTMFVNIIVKDSSDGAEEDGTSSKGEGLLAGIPMNKENMTMLVAGGILLLVVGGIFFRVARPKTKGQTRSMNQFTPPGLFNDPPPPPAELPAWQDGSSWRY